MVWKDCFGKELVNGEDVVIGGHYGIYDQIALTAGIVLELNEDNIVITYNWWEGKEEQTGTVTYHLCQYPDGIVKCVYKIFR